MRGGDSNIEIEIEIERDRDRDRDRETEREKKDSKIDSGLSTLRAMKKKINQTQKVFIPTQL